MSSEKKAMDLQFQVRQNAREYQDSVKELYSWEKDIKNKEQALKNAPAPTISTSNAPVRSHVPSTNETPAAGAKQQKSATSSPGDSAASTPTEKKDLPLDIVAQQHKKANDIKDRGNNYVKQSEYDRAIEAYTEAIEVYAKDPVYYINRALCYLKQECHERCVKDCEAAIALDNVCVKAYYRRMQANESLGNNMEALKDCTTVLAIDPKNIEAKRSLERINTRLRKIASKAGPNFSPARDDFIDILPFDKPAYKRSKAPMRRVPVVDVVTPRASQDEPKQLRISDEEIDRIFNSNCGYFEEVKKDTVKGEPKQKSKKIEVIKPAATQAKVVTIQEETVEIKPSQNIINEKDNKKISVETVKTTTEQKIEQKEADKTAKEQKVELKSANKTASEQKVEAKVANKTTLEQKVEQKAANKTASESKVHLKDADKITKTLKTVETATTSLPSEPELKQADSNLMERVPAPPAGTAQFYITWKELTPTQKYNYLKSIEIPNLCKILGAGFDSDTFTDLLKTLQDFYVPNKEPTTAAVLLEISKNDEFTILSMLMSKEEKQMIATVLNAIKEFPKNNADLLAKLNKAYNLT